MTGTEWQHTYETVKNKDCLGTIKDIFKPVCITDPGCDPNKGTRAGEALDLTRLSMPVWLLLKQTLDKLLKHSLTQACENIFEFDARKKIKVTGLKKKEREDWKDDEGRYKNVEEGKF